MNSMIVCDKCGQENLDGSRMCGACGSPLWMTGRSSDTGNLTGTHGNGSNGRFAPSVSGGQAGAEFSEQSTASPSLEQAHRVHATLVIERGTSAGKKFPLSSLEANIGRWDADSGVFPDVDLDSDDPEAKVSRRHARICLSNGNYLIEDLGSTNGTFVNRGRRLTPGSSYPLNDGDEIIVGKTFLRFRVSR